MKKVILIVAVTGFSISGFAQTLLSCSGATTGGSLIKSVELVKQADGLSIKSIDYNNQKNEVKIKSRENSPVSTKYIMDDSEEQKTSLVVSQGTKQAVMLYEAAVDGKIKTTIEFLRCK